MNKIVNDDNRAQIYLRPVGFLYGAEAVQALDARLAWPLAGAAAVTFTMLEATATGTTVLISPQGWADWLAALDDRLSKAAEEILARLTGRREHFDNIISNARTSHPLLMGIVNVTPDSFADGGEHPDTRSAIAHGHKLVAAGADILDIGGESTRPGARPVSLQQELDRVIPVIEGLKDAGVPISIDTRHVRVMESAVKSGAHIINDVSALTTDEDSLDTAAALNVPIVLMHAQGAPETMQENPQYMNVLHDVYDYLDERIIICERAGISRERLIVDPGIGFGKDLAHNLALLHGLSLFHGLGVPILLGVSRKSFIGRLTAIDVPRDRVPGSLAAQLAGASQGVQIIRAHDVAEMKQASCVFSAVNLGDL